MSVQAEKYQGRKDLGSEYYEVDNEEQKKRVEYWQWQVKMRQWAWRAIWYGFAALIALIVTTPLGVWWFSVIALVVVEGVAYNEFQNRYYVTIHPGGKRSEPKTPGINLGVIGAYVLVLASIRIMNIRNIMGAEEWGGIAFLLLLMLGILLLIFNSPKKPKRAPKTEWKPEDELPEAAVWVVDGAAVPADVLGPGGRYLRVYNALIRLDLSVRRLPKLDIDVSGNAICQNGAECILNVTLNGEWPLQNPFHMIESYKVQNKKDIEELLDNPVELAARKIIAAEKTDEELTKADADYSRTALRLILGDLPDDKLDSLVNPLTKSRLYLSLAGVEINYAAVNVMPSEAQIKQRAKKASEEADMVAEEIEIGNVALRTKQIMDEFKNQKHPIDIVEAVRIVQSERGKITSINQRVEVNPGQLEKIVAVLQMIMGSSDKNKGSP